MGKTQGTVDHEAKFLSSCEPVKPGKLCVSEIQWWKEQRIHSHSKDRSRKEEKSKGFQVSSIPSKANSIKCCLGNDPLWLKAPTFWTHRGWQSHPKAQAALYRGSSQGSYGLFALRVQHHSETKRQPWWSLNHIQSHFSLFLKNSACLKPKSPVFWSCGT